MSAVGPRVGLGTSSTNEDTDADSATTLSSALSSRHEREARESGQVGTEETPTPAQEEKEPDPGPPLLGEGALGLQQLLMGSKEAKDITMHTLYSASTTAIRAWRRKRKAYLKEVRIYNAGHAIKRSVRPVKDFVDEVIWEAVSKKKLHPHHRTQKRQDPNHVECANYILGLGEYKGLIQEDHKDPLVVLKSVKYQKGRTGATHEDRWFSYVSRRDKALEKIPEPQLSNKVFQRAHAKHLRNVLRPKVLKQSVAEAFRTGIHPGTE